MYPLHKFLKYYILPWLLQFCFVLFFKERKPHCIQGEGTGGGEEGRPSLRPLPEIIHSHVRGLLLLGLLLLLFPGSASPRGVLNPVPLGCHLLTPQCEWV